MYRGINLKGKNDSFKATLMKNIREPLGEINRDYIDEINYNFKDLHDMSITVPNKVFDKGQILVEPIYTQFLSKLQQVIIDLGDKKDRFVVAESEREDEFYTGQDGKTVKYKTKKLKCYSYEYTLKDKTLDLYENVYRQLYYNENEHPTNGDAIDISEGMLNMFENQTGWRVKYISDKAKREYSKALNQFYINIPNKSFIKLQKGTIIWEQDFNFNPIDNNNYIDIKLVYGKIITTDSNGKELKRETRSHDLDKIYTGVRHIKAVYNSTSDYQNAMIYTITLSDGMVITKVQEFGYLQDSNVNFQDITLSYTDGSEDTINVIKHRSFDKGSYKWLDFLRQDITNAFNVYVEFDTINLEISVYSPEEYGEHKGVSMSYEDSIKSINKKDGYEDIVNKLTVTSDKASIAEVNLFGGVDYILDYSYHYKYGFSEELKVAWDRYIASLESKQDRMFELRVDSNTNTKLSTKIESEKKAIDATVRSLQVARTTAMKEDVKGSMKDEIANLTTQINTKMDRFNLLATQLATIKADQDKINSELQLLSKQMTFQYAEDSNGLIFTDELIVEIDAWTICEETNDENYTTSFGLYEEYKQRLAERNKLKVDIDVDCKGVLQNLFIPPDLEWDYYIKLGDFVDIIADEKQDDYDDRIGLYIGTEGKEDSLLEKGMRLVGFKYIPKDHDIPSLNFTNKDEKADIFTGASNIGKTMDKAKNYMSTTKEILDQSASVNDFVNSMLYGNGMDNSILPIRNRSGRVKYDQTEAGMYIIDAENEDNQVYIGAGIIAFTSDRWLTSNCAINEEGTVNNKIKTNKINNIYLNFK